MGIIRHALPENKIIYLTALLSCFIVNSFAQTTDDYNRLEEIRKQRAEIYKTIYQNEELKKLKREYDEIISRSKSYGAFTFGWEVGRPNIMILNQDANANGLPSLNDKFQSLVFGYSRMNRRVTGDLLFQLTMPNKTSNGTHNVTLSGGGASWDKGYAIVSNERILFFPFAGIGWQSYTLRVSEKSSTQTANGLLELAQGTNSGSIYRGSMFGSIGTQLDVIWPAKTRNRIEWHTGIRFAYNPALMKGKYKYSDGQTNYKPDIKWREFQLSVLFKISGKTYYPNSLFGYPSRNKRPPTFSD